MSNRDLQVSTLKAGQWVEVRSATEILATLDENGRLDAMPFMPEMLEYCGRRFRVYKSAHKTCDTVQNRGRLRSLTTTVHLEGLRCHGAAHGGCEAECLLFWKDAWLKPVAGPGDSAPEQIGHTPKLEAVQRAIHAQSSTPENEVFSCQATELQNFTHPMHPWSPRQFLADLRSRNVGFFPLAKSVLLGLFNDLQRRRHGMQYPDVSGKLDKTPRARLDLQPGELVQIKSKAEIENTLDQKEQNRGLLFDREMVPYCGGTYRVKKRVRTIIDERTGRMLRFGSDAIMLEGVTCRALYHAYCPRSIYPYWREIWLKRTTAGDSTAASCGGEQAASCSLSQPGH